ncbi:endonuclease/exonuclease/phosphatase family protein [Pseudooceanicola sediminis]|uniref:Endonuclease/exonuclease/phosphatase family protein n=2 Tax=Pseudooceanicola sediminis TaxID=2211117 RepID=A0A399IX03_9RHOB|nr:endonuclease/exonuclease/phosphatase family protein [Puniceibacterium sp. HSS470]RII37728.1 endonuclease/exonuclease/phosphatase family protein [Pseudooceanicola sediminis]|tara:strand:+ start:5605 stop:6582 length:978 start_codon:yes stop_codon:yes gene_type:complete
MIIPLSVGAGTIRVAYYDTELGRDGPGLLLRDILGGADPQVAAVAQIITAARPDILVLSGVDFDVEGLALGALNATLATPFEHAFAPRPNTGMPTGLDLDGNGRRGEARDAQGYGRFSGAGGMAVLSRFAIAAPVQDFSALLWRDQPGTLMRPEDPGHDVQRLSSLGHWIVPVDVGAFRLSLAIFRATTPVFDGPEDRNGRRNHDEIAFWTKALTDPARLSPPFVIAGGANLDPDRGAGRRQAIRDLLTHPALQDPAPRGAQGNHTVDWPQTDGPGPMRVDYVLPSADLTLEASGVLWPDTPPLADTAARASRHRLVWVDLLLPR